MKFSTKAIHVGEEPDFREGATGDVVSPIHLSTTFARREVDKPTAGLEYARTENPTRTALEKRIAALENARFALAFSSGMAAETSLLLALLKSGDHIIASDDLYGGTRRLLTRIYQENFQIDITFVDTSNTREVEQAIQRNTRLIWLESPTNPLMKLCDISAISEIAHKHQIITVVDNTFMTPYFQLPLELGADIVVHSTTKYLNGHSDSIGGAVALSNDEWYEKIKFVQNAAGAILSPFDCYLVLRGTKTLAVRMEQHQANALQIARYLEKHPRVRMVLYPGLPSHPQYELARKQMKGSGGMISFELDGDVQVAKKFVESLKLFALAESLGGVESLIELPALMTHTSVPESERRRIGLSDSLIRLSVGIEDVEDLLEDLENAFHQI